MTTLGIVISLPVNPLPDSEIVTLAKTSLFNRPDNLTETVAGLKAIFHSCQSRANA